ncbi:cupin domain-containing protein [Pelagibacterium luteolum]|uniref:Cupin domain-containing protein n=1 Tax=Pelagibacterium luteolum TaxID=440168 RepID=A0A1G7S1D5_9HYPH|nr:cupin domain-containing protein [Pelagibacterium luteolum]SDG16842.1 Cupin domain-containing protein [Pelagibacterium luteolum]
MAINDPFFASGDRDWTDTDPGVKRRIMVWREDMMMVEVTFEKGASGTPHAHHHVQSTYVVEGAFEVTIDGVTQVVEKGGAFLVAPNLVHGVKALAAGHLIDAFSPMREDFL